MKIKPRARLIMVGREVLGPEDKSLLLEFVYPSVGDIGNGIGFMEFKTQKMLFEGKIEY